jgi:hypothetical protein
VGWTFRACHPETMAFLDQSTYTEKKYWPLSRGLGSGEQGPAVYTRTQRTQRTHR